MGWNHGKVQAALFILPCLNPTKSNKQQAMAQAVWSIYKNRIFLTCGVQFTGEKNVAFWRNYLFVSAVIYILPICLLALVPGVYAAWLGGFVSIVVLDVLTLLALGCIAFVPGWSMRWRKAVFTVLVYALAAVLILALGALGPGLVYLLAVSVFCVIIYPFGLAFLPVMLNFVVLSGYALLIGIGWISMPGDAHPLTSWIATSTNVLFLSILFSILIPRMFRGMEQTIEAHRLLRQQLASNQQTLEESLTLLKAKNKELEQFSFVVSHDLQEPLRMVSSFLTQLERRFGSQLEDKGRQYIYFAVDGAQRMKQTILDLLAYSRAGHLEDKPELLKIEELLDEVVAMLQKPIQTKNARIQYTEMPELITYRTPLFQIFQNLISNALKYTASTTVPHICISARERERTWTFAVQDNGIGIAPEYHERIFAIFQRLHPRDAYEGSGVGLAIVKKDIENLGGSIWVESGEHAGSTFYFTIPEMTI